MILSDLEGLGKWSKSLIKVKCDDCSIEKELKYKLYTSYGYSSGDWLCRKCKTKKNNLEKWGVENPFQLEEVKEKIKRTNLEKWGVENPSQNREINKKIKESISKLDKEEINNKRSKTVSIKYGVDNVSKLKEVKSKKIESYQETYGNDHNKQSEAFRKENFKIAKDPNYLRYEGNGVSIFNCSEKNHEFHINIDNYLRRLKCKTILCTKCNPIDKHQSGKEIKLYNLIKSLYDGEIIQNFKIGKQEIDIYLPELSLGFELNGIYWHSDKFKSKNFHKEKSEFFLERGIRIIHIWEDDFDSKFNIIKSQIINLLGLSNKIWARKCIVKEVTDTNSIRVFLDNNHIQGYVNSNLKLGLYYNDELVSLMTFDHFEGRKRMNVNEWNLNRFCNKLEYSVVGGASKLLNYFIKNYDVKRIISYADRDWSKGDLYENLGFIKIGESKPDYKYLVNDKRVYKSNFKKSVTGISESKLDLNKVWDCGKIKFELFKK
jgi:hypothetical protein